MTAFAAVKLDEDATTIGLVVDVAQNIERLHQATEFLERSGEPGRGLSRSSGTENLHKARGPYLASVHYRDTDIR